MVNILKEFTEKAFEVFEMLKGRFSAEYDEAGSIGRRYARQDEVGTPYCITVDYDSLKDNTVTLRERNSMRQKRVAIAKLDEWFWKLSTGRKTFDDLTE